MLKICTELRERTNEVRVTFSNQSKIISKHLQESNHGIAKGRMRVLRALKTSWIVVRSSPPIEVARAIRRLAKDVLFDTM